MHFAEDVIYSAMVAMLATSTLLKPLDEAGNEYTPPAAFTDGFLRFVFMIQYEVHSRLLITSPVHSSAVPFRLRVVPRSETALAMASEEAAASTA